MQVVFHIGAHCTGQDRLIRSLLKNRDVLGREGVAVPGPGRYRRTVSEAIKILRGAPASAEAQDVLLEAVLDTDDAERVVLSNESFICMASKVLVNGELYPRIGKSAWLRNAFPSADVAFALTLRNFATFLPALYDQLGGDMMDPGDFLSGTEPRDLMWSDVIEGLQSANPGASILVWCEEDSPILWSEIMREITGIDATLPLEGGDDVARSYLSEAGLAALDAVSTREDLTEAAWRQDVSEILAEHADEEAVYQEISLPGWTEELMDELTDAYDEDVATIERMPGVTLLTP